jgi:hypothetical protein
MSYTNKSLDSKLRRTLYVFLSHLMHFYTFSWAVYGLRRHFEYSCLRVACHRIHYSHQSSSPISMFNIFLQLANRTCMSPVITRVACMTGAVPKIGQAWERPPAGFGSIIEFPVHQWTGIDDWLRV